MRVARVRHAASAPGAAARTEPEGDNMSYQASASDDSLEQRLELASQPQNMGEDLTGRDHAWLLAVTVLVPAVLMLLGWYL
jgi:hypothetical protein